VIVGCRGAVTYDGGYDGLEVNRDGAGMRLSADWDGRNSLRFGEHRLWVDGNGRLRIKNGAPMSDDDGAPVGSAQLSVTGQIQRSR
jgi:hypothetical protein